MLKENQFVYTRWSKQSKEYYISKGYKCLNIKDSIYVKAEDLYRGSRAKVVVICDYCKKEYEKIYKDYVRQHEGGDCCKNCLQKKAKKILKEKYGENYTLNMNNAFKKKYGVENPMQVEEIKEKVFKTQIEKYGKVMGCISDDERKKGTEKSWSENSREKRRKTNLEKYGTEWPTQNAEVLSKRNDSFFKNGSTKTSKPQINLYNILKKKYENCELNYPCSNFLLDCKIEINNIKIDIEYDGQYWHQDTQRDNLRDEVVNSYGYKILRIKGKHKVPKIEEIEEKINELINLNKKICYIDTFE